MKWTAEERRILNLYNAGSIKDTVSVVLDALPDIYEPEVYGVAICILQKLNDISEDEFEILSADSEGCYAG